MEQAQQAAAPVAGDAQAPAAANQNPNAQPPGGPAGAPANPPAAAPQAAPQAPAAPAATDPAAAQQNASEAPNTDPKAGEIVQVRWEPTGYPGLDAGLKFIGDLGFSDKSPEFIAAENGDWSGFELYFLKNPVPGWETYLRIAKEALGTAQAAQAAKREAIHAANLEFGISLFGSEDGVNEALAFADRNADPGEAAQLQQMLSAGGLAAQAALLLIQANMRNSGESYGPTASVTTPNTGAGSPGSSQATLSRAEFAAECKKLRGKFGEGFEQTADYRALARRLA